MRIESDSTNATDYVIKLTHLVLSVKFSQTLKTEYGGRICEGIEAL